MSARVRRICAWSVGIVSSLVIIALIITAVLDLQVGDSTSSVIAGVAAVIGLAVSVITLIRTSVPVEPPTATPAQVHSRGRGAIAAGGSIRGNAIGKNAKATGASSSSTPAASPTPLRTDVSAEGLRALSAGGDIVDNAIGDGSER
ncbi:hypothetical protein [Amycolatopsis minnesotensis]|uniref:Superfamily III holin-X n=1 Tax=Amycolatopsis minnesotensis TaxID=337894 RepID=A0ABP5BAZ6_9PSEU